MTSNLGLEGVQGLKTPGGRSRLNDSALRLQADTNEISWPGYVEFHQGSALETSVVNPSRFAAQQASIRTTEPCQGRIGSSIRNAMYSAYKNAIKMAKKLEVKMRTSYASLI